MNQNRTASILQRYAIVLAVTATSYGLPPAQAQTRATANGHGQTQHTQSASQQQKR